MRALKTFLVLFLARVLSCATMHSYNPYISRNKELRIPGSKFRFLRSSVSKKRAIQSTMSQIGNTINSSGPSPIGIDTLRKAQVDIVDGLIPENMVKSLNPDAMLTVRWGTTILGVGQDRVDFPVQSAATAPSIEFKPTGDANSKYALLMVDMDAPNGRGIGENDQYLHWLVADIKNATDIPLSTIAVPYESPNPPMRSAAHRYVILLLKNGKNTPEGEFLKDMNKPVMQPNQEVKINRSHFNTYNFVKDNDFSIVAIEFFISAPQ